MVFMLGALLFFNPLKSQADSGPLSEPYPQDDDTAVAKALRTSTDTDFINAYIVLSAPEKAELETSLNVVPLTLDLITPMRKLRYDFAAQIEELMKWSQVPIDLAKPESFAKTYFLVQRPSPLHLLVTRGLCQQLDPGDLIVPPKPEPKLLKVTRALPLGPSDFAKKCDRNFDFYLQKLEGSQVRQEKLLTLQAPRLPEFWRGREQAPFVKRLWMTAERWESERTAAKNYSQRLRAIDLYANSLKLEQLQKYQQLSTYLSELERAGERALNVCDVLESFYQGTKIAPDPKELGGCAGKIRVTGYDNLALFTPLDPWSPKLFRNDAQPERRKYALELRKLYSASLRVLERSLPKNSKLPVQNLRKLLNAQLRDYKLSLLAAQLYESQSANSPTFDYEAEALRMALKSRKVASVNAQGNGDRRAAQDTLSVLTQLSALLKAHPSSELVELQKALTLQERICRAVIKALKKNL